jgi:pilus assembly protein CpaB
MRNRRVLLFLGLAALSGLGTAFVARHAADHAPVGLPVVVALEPATLGQPIDLAKVKVVTWPALEATPQGFFSEPSALSGRVLARSLVAGEPVLESSLLPQGAEPGLGALIQESSRAISVQVDDFVGVGGFLQPGSKVDVFATYSVDGQNNRRTEAILQNVRVLAVDVRVEKGDGSAQPAKVVTLEVSPRQARTLTQAEHDGKLKLALRNPKDNQSEARPIQMVLGTDVQDLRF